MSCAIFPRCSFSIIREPGVLRYFCQDNAEVNRGDSPEELSEKYGVEPERKDGRILVADVINVRENGADVRRLIKITASSDNALYGNVTIRLP